jgi:predicted AAA+ superfamily ATPase
MLIKRAIKEQILSKIGSNKAIIIHGPRQAGKTTLVNDVASSLEGKILSVSGEDIDAREWLSSQSVAKLKSYIGDAKFLIIDEAQKADQIGLAIKLIHDHIPEVQVIATGSSSFELSNQVGEPLVGRKWDFMLYPIAQLELLGMESRMDTQTNLESRLIYGSYPEVITANGRYKKGEVLESILDNFLFKDILAMDNLRKSSKLVDLLRLIAFQIGHEVSLSELSNNLGLSVLTVERYLDLLEKTFVIKRVGGFSRNLRKEVSKTCRYYFVDNGIRNAVIKNFNELGTRNDAGALWENYLFTERMKKREYQKIFANHYFWRTYDRKEIDLVEERDGRLFGYEFKWGDKTPKPPKEWLDTYDNSEFEIINRENYLEFIG